MVNVQAKGAYSKQNLHRPRSLYSSPFKPWYISFMSSGSSIYCLIACCRHTFQALKLPGGSEKHSG